MGELLAEAAALAGVDPSALRVERAERVTWGDSALGCADEDVMAAQVLTDGYWVVIDAGEQSFDFRMADGAVPILCPPGQGAPPVEDSL